MLVPDDTPSEVSAQAAANQMFDQVHRTQLVYLANKLLGDVLSRDLWPLTIKLHSLRDLLNHLHGSSVVDALLRGLTSKAQLNGQVLDMFIGVLFPALRTAQNIIVCRLATVEQLLSAVAKLELGVKAEDGFTIVAPCHHPNHWTLVIATLEATPEHSKCAFRLRVQFLDSFAIKRDRPEHVALAKCLLREFKRVLPPEMNISWTLDNLVGAQRIQSNNTDCGVWVAWWLARIATLIRDGSTQGLDVATQLTRPSDPQRAMLIMRNVIVVSILLGDGSAVTPQWDQCADFIWHRPPCIPALMASVAAASSTVLQPGGASANDVTIDACTTAEQPHGAVTSSESCPLSSGHDAVMLQNGTRDHRRSNRKRKDPNEADPAEQSKRLRGVVVTAPRQPVRPLRFGGD